MEGVVQGAFICNNERTSELSQKMYERNVPTNELNISYSLRPVQTRFVHMPTNDYRKQSSEPCIKYPTYDTHTEFSPGSSLPFGGYQRAIDTESVLRDIIFPMQNGGQSKFIPGTNSDLFNTSYLTQTNTPVEMPNQLLFSQHQFEAFNPNTHNLGNDTFNNSTRNQIKDCNPASIK